MKSLFTTAIILIGLSCYGQVKIDSGKVQKPKVDTVKVPVYLIDITDTVKGIVLYKKKSSSNKIFQVEGYNLLRGFKTLDGKWITMPNHVGALDNKKRRLMYWISIK